MFSERLTERVLDCIPGVLVWLTLLAVILLSFLRPLWAIYFIIAFDLYWLLRITYLLVYVLVSWARYRRAVQVDWRQRLQTEFPNFGEYYHLIILPTYTEPANVVDLPFQALERADYDKSKFIVVLAGEERDGQHFEQVASYIRNKYGALFHTLLCTLHPKDLPDELPGKGSNTHYAARQAHQLIDQLGIGYDKVIVSNFDIDTVTHPQYFACLTHQYLSQPNPTRASYQPVAMYLNNVWESNPIIRVVASSTTFWLFTDLARSQRLFTFSSHSMSFQALVDVGYWDKTIVTEDSRIFLQGLERYSGDYRTVPLYVPVYMNTVDIGRFWRSLRNQYKQIRRWAWGVEHFSWMVKKFWLQDGPGRRIPWKKKWYYLLNLAEGMYSWATAPLIILVAGYLPLWMAGESLRATALYQNTPYLLAILMRLSMAGLVITSILYTLMLHKPPSGMRWRERLVMLGQWLLVPVTLIIFGSLPAIDAQTRLLLGGKFRLGFWVTEKR